MNPLTKSFYIYFLCCFAIQLFGTENQFETLFSNEKSQDIYSIIQTNPFKINFSPKEDLTNEDYINIQNQLIAKKGDISTLVKKLYPINPGIFPKGFTNHEDFLDRISRGINQVLIDPDKGLFPTRIVEKINEGGDNCIACYSSYNRLYPQFIKGIPDALKASGFNGYCFLQIGGFPNPTGEEIQYVGVPYANKVFLMLEAKKLGFNKVITIDSSFLPLRDPTPLFNSLDHQEVIFIGDHSNPGGYWRYIFPPTYHLLKELTGTNVLNIAPFVWGGLLGFNFKSDKVTQFIEEYYQMVRKGVPFISCFPDQFVLTALIAKPEYRWQLPRIDRIYVSAKQANSTEEVEESKKEGYFFYNRKH